MDREGDAARDSLAQTAAGPSVQGLGILRAGERLIAERGFARATVEDIAEAAGVAVDVFYAHFPGKGALLRALNDQFVERVTATIDDSTRSGIWSNARAADLLDVAARSTLDVVFLHEGLLRAFLAHGATDRSLAEGLKKLGTRLHERLLASLHETDDGKAVEPKPLAFALVLAVGIAHHYVLVGDSWSGIAISREEIAHETVKAVSAYLGLDTTPAEVLSITR